MEKALQELTNLGSAGVSHAIEEYTRWYLVSAIGWLTVGIVFVICGIMLRKLKINDSDWNDWLRYLAMVIVIGIGVLMIVHNLSTVCAPEAYAIHKFILDIKP